MKKNDLFEVTIEDMSRDGEGIGHVDGLTVFVKDTAPGDRIRARLTKEKKKLAYGRLEEVLEASPCRMEPVCGKARSCGGCTMQHISYEKQLELKSAYVENCLRRIGGIENAKALMEPILGMEYPYAFRNKMQFPVGTDREGTPQLGFYAGRTHALIPLTGCPVGHPVNQVILQAVKEYIREASVPVYDEEKHGGLLRHVLTRVGFGTGQVMVCLVVNGESLPKEDILVERLRTAVDGWYETSIDERKRSRIDGSKDSKSDGRLTNECDDRRGSKSDDRQNKYADDRQRTPIDSLWDKPLRLVSVCVNINTEKTNRILGFRSRVISGASVIEDTIGDIRFEIAPESFFQVNPVQTEKLYGKALEYAGLTGEETVWDMYCGIGTISLFLARRAKKVYGVEIVPQAIENARRNAELNAFTNAEFFVGKAEEIVPKLYAEDPEKYRADVVVVDPPRKGCDRALLDTLISMAPLRIVYVSCDPATLARDVAILREGGYQPQRVTPTDMFPHSSHVECIVLLQLSNRKPDAKIRIDINLEDYYRIKDSK